MKKASPKLRQKLMFHVRRSKLRGRYRKKPLGLKKAKRGGIIAREEERPSWIWTIIDTLDTFGVFEYLLGTDYDDEPEPKQKAKPPPRKTKKQPSRQFSGYIRTI